MTSRGTYVGDVTALHLLRDEDDRGIWLAYGMGGQVWIHPIDSRNPTRNRIRNSKGIQVTQGARVHGLQTRYKGNGTWDLVAFGDKQVSLWKVEETKNNHDVNLNPYGVLPRFNSWVMDVAFSNCIKGTGGSAVEIMEMGPSTQDGVADEEGDQYQKWDGQLAVGLSDNTVQIWGLEDKVLCAEYRCSVPALLYSMELNWGKDRKAVYVLSGTAFCTILSWRIDPTLTRSSRCDALELHGHEGSIHRLRWMKLNKQFVSASDDRTLRIWDLDLLRYKEAMHDAQSDACVAILYGHTGRIWDVDVRGDVLASASEDGTVRLWDPSNRSLFGVIKAHVGRGAWRCVMDLNQGCVFSGGADASVKYWDVQEKLDALVHTGGSGCGMLGSNSKGGVQHIVYSEFERDEQPMTDSSAEYVRCLHLADMNTLFLGTNRGKLMSFDLQEKKKTVFACTKSNACKSPPSVMSLHALPCIERRSWLVAAGDIGGGMMWCSYYAGHSLEHCHWTADVRSRVLAMKLLERCTGGSSTYLVMSLDASGNAHLWNIGTDKLFAPTPTLLLSFANPFGVRFTCGDVSMSTTAVILGDQKGSIVSYRLSTDVWTQPSITTTFPLRFQHCKGATVSAKFVQESDEVLDFFTTGHDGMIRFYTLGNFNDECISCSGVLKASDISMVLDYCNLRGDKVIAGFHARDFVVYNLSQGSEVFRKPCGGWRRPVSFLCSDSGENGMSFCFSYVTNGQVHAYLKQAPIPHKGKHLSISGSAVCTSYHGKEIHSSCFIPCMNCPILITGAEDGLLRTLQPKHALGAKRPKLLVAFNSTVIGEQAAGTIVKAIDIASAELPDKYILVSGGSKEVLMVWQVSVKCTDSIHPVFDTSALWLSTKPPREGLRPTNQKQTGSHHRCMSVAALPLQKFETSCIILIASASSDNSISTFAFHSRTRKWRYLQLLKYHTCPVLDVDLIRLGNDMLLLSSSSDGCVCIWDLSNSLASATSGVWHFHVPLEEVEVPMQVLWTPHDGGANSIAASRIDESSLLVVVGGEDSSISIYQLSSKAFDKCASDTVPSNVMFHCTVPAAHMSAIKCVWTDGMNIFSSGLDQRVRMWSVCYSSDKVMMGLKKLQSCTVEVPEVEAMSVWPCRQRGGFLVALSGRGTQFVQFDYGR